jgi:GNAT superfamily N-acetyltransferase
VVKGAVVVREAQPGDDDDAVAQLIVDYLAWADGRLRSEYGVDLQPQTNERVLASLGGFRPPAGLLLVAEYEGRAVGVGALRRLADTSAEVKRMYVAPEARSLHIGSAILDRLIDEGRAWGASALRLDTCDFMTDAQRLYRSRGFVERQPYEGTEIPPEVQEFWIFFERML